MIQATNFPPHGVEPVEMEDGAYHDPIKDTYTIKKGISCYTTNHIINQDLLKGGVTVTPNNVIKI